MKRILTAMLGQVVEVEGGAVSSGHGCLTDEGGGSWVEVDGVGESDEEVVERDVETVTGKVSVVGERVHHGARASSYNY